MSLLEKDASAAEAVAQSAECNGNADGSGVLKEKEKRVVTLFYYLLFILLQTIFFAMVRETSNGFLNFCGMGRSGVSQNTKCGGERDVLSM